MLKSSFSIRIIFIIGFFILGLSLVIFGWTLTGKMTGLILMLLGVALLLTALLIYNQPYGKDKK